MKKTMYSLVALSILSFASCATTEEETTANTETVAEEPTAYSGTYYTAEGATITWKARHYADTDFVHVGTVAAVGNAVVTENEITGGSLTFDLTTIDEEGDTEMTQMLEGHLKAPDFFDVAIHPAATFTITGSEAGKISGTLEVLGLTKNIDIPVETTMTATDLTVNGAVEVDLLAFSLPALVAGQTLPEEEKMQSPYPVITFEIAMTLTKPEEM